MQISEILELLGDEEINVGTLITIEGNEIRIIEKDIMEIVFLCRSNAKTDVSDILKLMLDGTIIGSTEIHLYNDDEDMCDLFQGKTSDEELQLTTTH